MPMDRKVPGTDVLLPSDLDCWRRTRADLAAAVAVGPGIVALVGPEGSGKTYTLIAFALSAPGGTAKLRTAGDLREPGVSVDLVDGMDEKTAPSVSAGPDFDGTQVVAMRAERLLAFLVDHPDARVVQVHPMASADIRAMIEVRRSQLGLGPGAFTLKALSTLDRLCDGNPRKLDRLFGTAERAAKADRSPRISGAHVEWAERSLAANWQPGRPQPSPVAHDVAPEAAAAFVGPLLAPEGTQDESVSPNVMSAGAPGPSTLRNQLAAATKTTPSVPISEKTAPNTPKVEPAPAPLEHANEPGSAAVRPRTMSSWDILGTPLTPEERARLRSLGRGKKARNIVLASAAVVAVAGLALAVPLSAVVDLLRYAGTAANTTRYALATSEMPQGRPRAPVVTAVQTYPAGGSISAMPPIATPQPSTSQAMSSPLSPQTQIAVPPHGPDAPVTGPIPTLATPLPPVLTEEFGRDVSLRPESDPIARSLPSLSPIPLGHPATAVSVTASSTRLVATESAVDLPGSPPETDVRLAPTPASARPGQAVQLLAFGRALVSIGQISDARKMFEASAEMGNSEAASASAAYNLLPAAATGRSRPRHRAAGPAVR